MPLDISEYDLIARDQNSLSIQAGREPARAFQQVAIGGASVQSAAFQATTRLVRVHTDAACRIAFGDNPTASATSMRLPAGATEYFGVVPGHKVAAITSS